MSVPVTPAPATVAELSTTNAALEAEVKDLRGELDELKEHVQSLHAVTPTPLKDSEVSA